MGKLENLLFTNVLIIWSHRKISCGLIRRLGTFLSQMFSHASSGYNMYDLSRIEQLRPLDWWLINKSHYFLYTMILEHGDNDGGRGERSSIWIAQL